jgi:hypothetical protein
MSENKDFCRFCKMDSCVDCEDAVMVCCHHVDQMKKMRALLDRTEDRKHDYKQRMFELEIENRELRDYLWKNHKVRLRDVRPDSDR